MALRRVLVSASAAAVLRVALGPACGEDAPAPDAGPPDAAAPDADTKRAATTGTRASSGTRDCERWHAPVARGAVPCGPERALVARDQLVATLLADTRGARPAGARLHGHARHRAWRELRVRRHSRPASRDRARHERRDGRLARPRALGDGGRLPPRPRRRTRTSSSCFRSPRSPRRRSPAPPRGTASRARRPRARPDPRAATSSRRDRCAARARRAPTSARPTSVRPTSVRSSRGRAARDRARAGAA